MLETTMKRKPYPQQELAHRLITAMEDADISQAELARECGVTIQAVHDWRMTGRIGKHHLPNIARVTNKTLEYFLVGLGRAAAIFVIVLLGVLAVPPRPAMAFDIPQIVGAFARQGVVISTHCVQWLRRLFAAIVPKIKFS